MSVKCAKEILDIHVLIISHNISNSKFLQNILIRKIAKIKVGNHLTKLS